MKLDKLTIKAQEALSEAQTLAQEGQNQVVDIPHVLTALLSEGGIPIQILGKLGVNTGIVREIALREAAAPRQGSPSRPISAAS
jgi:ATP-dependent Clp protease ATP-binding subunit ClpB